MSAKIPSLSSTLIYGTVRQQNAEKINRLKQEIIAWTVLGIFVIRLSVAGTESKY